MKYPRSCRERSNQDMAALLSSDLRGSCIRIVEQRTRHQVLPPARSMCHAAGAAHDSVSPALVANEQESALLTPLQP